MADWKKRIRVTIARPAGTGDEIREHITHLRAIGWHVLDKGTYYEEEEPHVDVRLLIGLRRTLEMGVPAEELRERISRVIEVIEGDLARKANGHAA